MIKTMIEAIITTVIIQNMPKNQIVIIHTMINHHINQRAIVTTTVILHQRHQPMEIQDIHQIVILHQRNQAIIQDIHQIVILHQRNQAIAVALILQTAILEQDHQATAMEIQDIVQTAIPNLIRNLIVHLLINTIQDQIIESIFLNFNNIKILMD